jgi:hypothetical protein
LERNPATVEIKVTGCAVNFSGQTFYEAQSQNCETGKTNARPARQIGGGSGEIEMAHLRL